MENPRTPKEFQLRFLLNPAYVWRRARSLRSFGDLRGRVANLGLYLFSAVDRYLLGAPSRPSDSAPLRSPAPVVRLNARDGESVLNAELFARREELAGRFQAALPFKHLVLDGFLDPAFCSRLVAEFPAFDPVRFRNERGHLGKGCHENVATLGPSFRELDSVIQSEAFLNLVGELTGIRGLIYDPDYVGGGAHESLESMELDPHVDFTVHPRTELHRRVNLLLYLNPEWEESWGGVLELHVDPWKAPEEDPVRTVVPLFNRCVLFETSDRSWHGFQAIRAPKDKKGLTRRSFALYLYTREDPRGIRAIPGDLTVFVDRPLPPEFKAGRTLTEEDIEVLRHLIVRRDWRLKYLYARAIELYNDWKASEARCPKD